ncbi:MAG: potassium-transporting ATPase KdpC subunit [Planctomycetota bacterium]|jgi:K+-transporting ATPase ATPase C chain|nr:potassium-transporting ATPase KdpC subunit [Planctomycetota bacterium]
MIREHVRPAIVSFLLLTIITGILYPLSVSGIAQVFFRERANGSLIYRNGNSIGSLLIGQHFDDPKYLWSRISSTSPVRFNAASSSGSNLGPSNSVLIDAVKARIEALKAADPDNTSPIPVDLVTSSASGLDPHISLAAAYYQIPRVARLRGLSQDTVKSIVRKHSYSRFLGLIGEPVINVLKVNLDLDSYKIEYNMDI